MLRIYRRAVRHLPMMTQFWASYLLALERTGASDVEIDEGAFKFTLQSLSSYRIHCSFSAGIHVVYGAGTRRTPVAGVHGDCEAACRQGDGAAGRLASNLLR